MRIIKPPKLNRGDKIGIITPSDALLYEDLPSRILRKRALRKAIDILENFGFRVVLGDNIYKWHSDYMAGTDKERAHDLNKMFADRDVKAIFCLAGGSSSNRILPLIDFDNIRKNPKIFIGMSDVTTLLTAIFAKTGLVTFHGPNILSNHTKKGNLALSKRYTTEILFGLITCGRSFGKIPQKTQWQTLKSGKTIVGRLLGGNLEVFLNLSGTGFFPSLKNSIIFWEELDEDPCDLDFFLTHLRLLPNAYGIKGMVVGKLLRCRDRDYKNELKVEQVLIEVFKDFGFPIIHKVNFGHTKNQATLPIGIKAKLNPRGASLEILEPAVS